MTIMFDCKTEERANSIRESICGQLKDNEDFADSRVIVVQLGELVRLDISESCETDPYVEIDI